MKLRGSSLVWIVLALCVGCGSEVRKRPLPALIAALDGADEAERWRAIEVIVERGAESIPALSERLRRPSGSSQNPGTNRQRDGRYFAAQTLGALAPHSIPALIDALAATEEVARIHAQHVLLGLSLDATHVEQLGQLLVHANVMTAGRAGELLRAMPPEQVERALRPALSAAQPLMRRRALRTLEMREDGWGWPVLKRLLDDQDPDVRAETLKVISQRLAAGAAWDDAAPTLIAHLEHEPVERNRAWVAAALEAQGPNASPHIMGAIEAKPEGVAAAYMPGVLEALGQYDEHVLDTLSTLSSSGSPVARVRALTAGWALVKRAEHEGKPVQDPERTRALEQDVGDRLLQLAAHDDQHARVEALMALGQLPERAAEVVPRLKEGFARGDLETITAALHTGAALWAVAGEALIPLVEPLTKDDQQEVREVATAWLSHVRGIQREQGHAGPRPGLAPDAESEGERSAEGKDAGSPQVVPPPADTPEDPTTPRGE